MSLAHYCSLSPRMDQELYRSYWGRLGQGLKHLPQRRGEAALGKNLRRRSLYPSYEDPLPMGHHAQFGVVGPEEKAML